MSKTARGCPRPLDSGRNRENSIWRSCHGLRTFHRFARTCLVRDLPGIPVGVPDTAHADPITRHPLNERAGQARAERVSTTNAEALDEALVASFVCTLEVVEQLATLGYELQ